MRKICVVTGTRADYGLLRWVIDGISKSSMLQLQIVATGMHLSHEFGLTFKEIENDGYNIDLKVEMLLSSDSSVGITKSIGLGIIGFADAFKELNPDIVLLLGDRFEIFAAATAALISKIPVAHCHGGETTEGAFDESIRHSITKMSHLHFVAAREYQERVLQLGEDPENVHLVGGLGIDNIKKLSLLDKSSLESELEFKFQDTNYLVTFHPVTLDTYSGTEQITELLRALSNLVNTGIIFTMPNSDTGSRPLMNLINNFCSDHEYASSYTSLGQIKYLSTLKYVDAVIGNSSSGLLEAPTFKTATINIGDRQKGRLMASSVINCDPNCISIQNAINHLNSHAFKQSLNTTVNPNGSGGSADKIIKVLESYKYPTKLQKKFHSYP
ncbi:UDP-N-acetylglucosamine 2-epimerase [Synechococcus sp. RS9916]|uniref:UDP-N-acetylglucosamine 2-epimerase n=1 Tax=Synechococcus sp. RS9916 TaxID=221359 RepID=UPI001E3AA61C|nr:UDP-N-acetylglucosamine 2-epimerase [Synechococcus sp. RS9916]